MARCRNYVRRTAAGALWLGLCLTAGCTDQPHVFEFAAEPGDSVQERFGRGKTIAQQVEPAKGLGSAPDEYPVAEAVAKFRDLAGRVVGDRVTAIEDMALGLETLDDARDLAALLKVD